MTNYQKIMKEMDFQTFVDMMILNCDGCQNDECPLRNYCATGDECEEAMIDWLNQEVDK